MSTQDNHPRRVYAKHQSGPDYQHNDGVVQHTMQQLWSDEAGFPLLPDEQPVTTVRDSLYDLIPLGPREEKLISTAPFLRLQKIKQLGYVYRVWPGATHTRYEHSLGAYYLALRALRSLLQRGADAAGKPSALRIRANLNGQRRIVVAHKGITPLHSLIHTCQE